MYRDYNEIDNEILELITDQIRFEDIKSLLDKKYIKNQKKTLFKVKKAIKINDCILIY